MEYRKEIDGLRALAVAPVILFHAGFNTFSGGFVGVDVFFVISGFLITKIILDLRATNSFTLADFYERRARRILPALFLVLGTCLLPSWLWMTPNKLEDFGESLMAVVLFISNILFWREADYFGPAAEEMPLLHTWSLAVEEQYYVIYPLAIALLWPLGRKRLARLLAIAACVSLGLSEWAWRHQPTANFFLAPMRAWELLIGGIVAFGVSGDLPARVSSTICRQVASVVGLALLAYAIFFFDKRTPVPSLVALIPTVGAALIITFARADTFVGRLLGLRPVVGLGLISYSAYLWHQPLFAFARLRSPDELSASFMGLFCMVSLLLAFLSWKFIEQPFRNRRFLSRKMIFILAGTSSILFLAIGGWLDRSKGADFRYSQDQKSVLALLKYPTAQFYNTNNCHLSADEPYGKHCYADIQSHANGLLVWGDSHAAALHIGVFAALPDIAKVQLTSPGCPPVPDYDATDRVYCRQLGDRVMEILQQAKSPVILLHANWRRYWKDPKFLKALDEGLGRLRRIGARVVLVGSMPQWRPSLPEVVAGRMYQHGLKLDELPFDLVSNRYAELRSIDEALFAVGRRHDIEGVSMLDLLCRGDHCRALLNSPDGITLTTWDYGHLTVAGSNLAGRLLTERIFPATIPVLPQ